MRIQLVKFHGHSTKKYGAFVKIVPDDDRCSIKVNRQLILQQQKEIIIQHAAMDTYTTETSIWGKCINIEIDPLVEAEITVGIRSLEVIEPTAPEESD